MRGMEKLLGKNASRILADYFSLLRIQSVGADPERAGECGKCAVWIKDYLERNLGFSVSLYRGESHPHAPPVVLGERKGKPGAPSILFYGHYDVQPEDPVEAWDTPPFEPVEKGGRVFCRGAQDDKGQWFAFLEGVRSLIEDGGDIPDMKIVLEGQEESGSSMLIAEAGNLAGRIAADYLLVCDTSAGPDFRPAIVAGLRGVASMTVSLSGPGHDLHSGSHGGVAPNPAQGIAELVASLHTASGAPAPEGFCSGIVPPGEDELAAAREGALSPAEYEKAAGCPPCGGEEGVDMTERLSFLPTIEVNGIHSGYGGPGGKTVIPAKAVAKLSMRLVPGQDPAKAVEAVCAHLESRVPRGMKMEISDIHPGAPGFRLPLSSPAFALARRGLSEIDPRGPLYQWDGASIPVVSVLQKVSGAAPLIVGFGREEDRIHSPNESYGLDQFARAMRWGRAVTAAIAAERK